MESRKFFRKAHAFLISLACVFSFLPVNVMAEETLTIEGESAETTVGNIGIDDNDSLFAEYVNQLFQVKGAAEIEGIKNTGSRFDEGTPARNVYDAAHSMAASAAAGSIADTVIKLDGAKIGYGPDRVFTASDLDAADLSNGNGGLAQEVKDKLTAQVIEDIHFSLVIDSLLADHPYEFYWYDKTKTGGASASVRFSMRGYKDDNDIFVCTSVYVNECSISFAVASEYAADKYVINTAKAQSASEAAQNAESVIAAHNGEADRVRLDSYRQEICDRTSYNEAAAGGNMAYGNPWQLIWVFDNDANTNVVCEGYSKAFQYLCDQTDFENDDITCYTAAGTMDGGTGAGAHMWNIVTMDDRTNYLVDVTNCDSGTIGYPDQLFLAVPSSGNMTDGYVYSCNGSNITYIYDDDSKALFSEIELTIGEQDNSVRHLSFAKDSYEMTVGSSMLLWNELLYEPQEADSSTITVTSSNPEVIEISDGYIYARNRGTAALNAVAGKVKASAEFRVLRYADNIEATSDTDVTLSVGEEAQLGVRLLPEGEEFDESPVWAVAEPADECISVNQNGLVEGMAVGEATVTASIQNGPSVQFYIHVKPSITDFWFTQEEYDLYASSDYNLLDFMKIEPEDADISQLEIISTNTDAVEVRDGIIYAKEKGTATVIASYGGSTVSAVFHVFRYAEGIENVSEQKVYLPIEGEKELAVRLLPEGHLYSDQISWRTEGGDPECVSVSENGVVRANRYGNTSVIATTNNGYSAIFYVYVYAPAGEITLNQEDDVYLRYGTTHNIWNFVSCSPSEAWRVPLTITSERPEYVTVNGEYLEAAESGSSVIRVAIENGDYVEFTVHAGDYIAAIGRDSWEPVRIKNGEEEELEYVTDPADGLFSDDEIIWRIDSGNEYIELHDDEPVKVKAKAVGMASVTATTKNGLSVSFDIYVYDDPTSVSLKTDTIYTVPNYWQNIRQYFVFEPDSSQESPLSFEYDDSKITIDEYEDFAMYEKGETSVEITAANGQVMNVTVICGNYATGIESVGETYRELHIDDQTSFEYQLYGDEGFTDEVTWSVVSGENVVTVDSSTGEVTAIGEGDAQIEARTKAGICTYYDVHVIPEIHNLWFTEERYEIFAGGTYSVTDFLQYDPYDADFSEIEITSTDTDVIEVVGGNLNTKKSGEATIIARYQNLEATADFKVVRYAQGIEMVTDSTIYLPIDGQKQLEVRLLPEGEEFDDEINWWVEDSGTGCVTVDSNGLVVAHSYGFATVYVSAYGYSASCNVYVHAPAEEITLNQSNQVYLRNGTAHDIWNFVSCSPAEAWRVPLTITSENPEYVTVNGEFLEAAESGSSVIRVAIENGDYVEFTVHVGDYIDGIYRDIWEPVRIKNGEEEELKYVTDPADGLFSDDEIIWRIDSGSEYIELYDDGPIKVKANAVGIASVTATTKNGLSVSFDIYVYDDPTSVSLKTDTIYTIPDQWQNIRQYLAFEPESSQESPLSFEYDDRKIGINGYDVFGMYENGETSVKVTASNGQIMNVNIVCGNYATGIESVGDAYRELHIGDQTSFEYQLYGDEGFTDEVTWSVVSGENVVTVDSSTGEVTAIGEGDAQIEARTKAGYYTYYDVHVIPAISNLWFTQEEYDLDVSNSYYLFDFLNVEPEGADLNQLEIISTNTDAVEIQDFTLFANETGEATITVTYGDLSVQAVFRVHRYAEDIENVSEQIVYLPIEGEKELVVKLLPEGQVYSDQISWRTEGGDPECVSVSENGVVRANYYGNTSVVATTYNGSTAIFYVYVYAPADEITLNQEDDVYLRTGTAQSIWDFVTCSPSEAWRVPLTITSERPEYVTVSGEYLEAAESGSSVIRAAIENGDYVEFTVHTGDYIAAIGRDSWEPVRIKNGEEEQLKYILHPLYESEFSDDHITWSINGGSECIELYDDGPVRIKAKAVGTANVTATTMNGSSVSYEIYVYDDPTSVSLKTDTIYTAPYQWQNIRPYFAFEPESSQQSPLNFEYDASKITINEYDSFVMFEKGETSIKATASNGQIMNVNVVCGNYAEWIETVGDTYRELNIGDETYFEYQLHGEDYSEDRVTWFIEEGEGIVSVDPDSGRVKALSPGHATIGAKSLSNVYVYFDVYVIPSITSFWFTQDEYELSVDHEYNLYDYLIYEPYNEDPGVITVTSTDTDVIEIRDGMIYAKDKGTATVIASYGENTVSAVFNVFRYAEYIQNIYEGIVYVPVGTEKKLECRLLPEGLEFDEEAVWYEEYDGHNSIEITPDGTLRGLNAGSTQVSAHINNGNTIYITVNVYEEPESISFKKEEGYIRTGSTKNIADYLNVTPEGAAYGPLAVESDDVSVISVENGALAAHQRGTATITVIDADGRPITALFHSGMYADSIEYPDCSGNVAVESTKKLQYQTMPANEDTSEENVKWTVISGSEYVSVDQYGNYTGLAVGEAVIEAESLNGSKLTYYIRVNPKLKSMRFRSGEVYLGPDQSLWVQEIMEFDPSESTWSVPLTVESDDPSVISADGEYLHTGSSGTTKIRVKADTGQEVETFVHIGHYAQYISPKEYHFNLGINEGAQLEYVLGPEEEGPYEDHVTWTMGYHSSEDVISLDTETGYVTAHSPGYAYVTASLPNGSSAEYYITVYEEPETVKFNQPVNYLQYGYSAYIKNYLDIEPEGAEYFEDFIVETSDPDIIDVSGNYLYTRKSGECDITVRYAEGESVTARFKVGYYATSIWTEDQTNVYLQQGDTRQLTYVTESNISADYEEHVVWKVVEAEPANCISVEEGLVTAVQPGKAEIRAITLCGYYVSYYVTVTGIPDALSWNTDHIYIPVNSDVSVWSYLDVEPAELENCVIDIIPNDTGIVTTDGRHLHGAAAGETTVTVKSGKNIVITIPVTVGDYADSIQIESVGMRIRIGTETAIKYKLYSRNGAAMADEHITWKIHLDPSSCIDLIDNKWIRAKAYGNAVLEGSIMNGTRVYLQVKVVDAPDQIAFENDEYYLIKGGNMTLEINAQPEHAEAADYIWTSTNRSAVYIDYHYENMAQIRYGDGDGDAVIRVTSPFDENVYAECTVHAFTGTPPVGITTDEEFTGYVGYTLKVPVTCEPVKSDRQFSAECTDDTVSILKKNTNYIWLNCNHTGTAEVTVKADNSTAETTFTVNVIEGIPEVNDNLNICEVDKALSSVNPMDDPSEYIFVAGRKYSFTYDRYPGTYAPMTDYGSKMYGAINDCGLFKMDNLGAMSSEDGASIQVIVFAAKAGTIELPERKGIRIKLICVNSEPAQDEIKVDSTAADPEAAQSVAEAMQKDESSLGISDILLSEANNVEIPENITVTTEEKLVVKPYLDVMVKDCGVEEEKTGTLSVSIEPMYKLTVVNETTEEENDVTEAQPLEVSKPVTLTIPVGNAFEGMDIQTVMIRHIKDDGTEYMYTGSYDPDSKTVTFVNPNGFSEFHIMAAVEKYTDAEYIWTETETGYEVKASITNETTGEAIEETAIAEKTETQPDCTHEGKTVYRAVFENKLFSIQTKEFIIEPLGHEYTVEWSWNDDLTKAEAVFTCTRCGESIRMHAVVVIDGLKSTASVMFNGTEYTDERTAEGPQLPDSISIEPNEMNLTVGETGQLTVHFAPAGTKDSITWGSSDSTIASVDTEGNVTGLKAGIASITAATANGLTAECKVTVTEDIVVHSAAMAMEGTLKINFYVTMLADMEDGTYFRMTVGADTEGILVHASEAGKDSSGRIRLTCPFFSTQMRDTVRLTAEDSDGHRKPMTTASGKDVTEGLEYSALTYIKNKENGSDAKLAALVKAMNNYGKYAQKYFNYGELDSEPDAVSLNAGDLSDYESQKSGSTEGLTLKSATLEFESGTSINVYYTLASGHNISEYTFRINETEVTPVYNSSKKAYGVTVASVASNELQNMYEFTAVRRGTAETLTLRYGAYSFAYSKLSNSATAEALQNLMKAMYWYNQAAVAYFQ